MLAEDKLGAVGRASALARHYDAYPEIWLGVFTRTRSLPYFRNEAILIDSTGKVVWTFEKTYPVFGGESLVTIAGPGVVPVADAPYGRLSTVICNDVGYPGMLRQADQNRAGILLAQTHELFPFWASADAAEATYQSIENGYSMVRPNRRRHVADYRLRGMGDRQPGLLHQQRWDHTGERADPRGVDHLQPDRQHVPPISAFSA